MSNIAEALYNIMLARRKKRDPFVLLPPQAVAICKKCGRRCLQIYDLGKHHEDEEGSRFLSDCCGSGLTIKKPKR